MTITGTHFNYYLVCRRKLWLFAGGITMENNSDLVYEGRLIHETSYPQRPERYEEVAIEGIRIDFYDRVRGVVHEIKKSDSIEEAHRWQLRYYIHVLERNGIQCTGGILEYPALRKTEQIVLTSIDCERLAEMEREICEVAASENCPPVTGSKICPNCSYYEFCHVGEPDE